jgi:CheY-like chemotaxis protein/anti-sigma regulatory factor (Ser/Thr protein kinase)
VALPDVRLRDEVLAPIARLLPDDFAASATISFRNVTEARRTEARRLDFYSIMAHDLRSPLSAMLLRSEFILSGGRGILSAELTADLRRIEANVRSMTSLINDFLELARLEGGGYQLVREELDAAALVTAAVEEIRPVVDESRLTITVEAPGKVPLHADRRRLMQVLMNLLANAVKFTPAGGSITVAARPVGGSVELRVTDPGVGNPEQARASLFQRYQRIEGSRAGTGLGLMIVREIVEAHGGDVGVSSVPGEGSSFWLRLPAGAVRASSAQVLVVDDDDDLRETIALLLDAQGYSVATACNGQMALDRLRTGDAPAVIVCDMKMPVMTGPELIQHLNADARLARIPVLAMSGDLSILPQAPPGALVLQKPIQVDRLLDYVGRHIRGVRRRADGP